MVVALLVGSADQLLRPQHHRKSMVQAAMKRQWPLVIEEVEWNGDGRIYSKGHHTDEAFRHAVARGRRHYLAPDWPIVRQWWRFVPAQPDDPWDTTIVVADGPGRGAVPVTAEDTRGEER